MIKFNKKTNEIKIELLLFTLLIIIFVFTIANINFTTKEKCKTLIEEGVFYEREQSDTLGVLLLKINSEDSIIYKRINLTPITIDEYCQLLQSIVDEGICDIKSIEYY